MFSRVGIIQQTTCPYTPQYNGCVERKHYHLLDIAHSLKFQASIPTKYWGYYVLTVAYLINILPSPVLKRRKSHELVYGVISDLRHIRIFECLCFAKHLAHHDKFETGSIPSICMGYSTTQKGHVMINIHTSIFFTSRDVIFREDVFF